MFSMTASYLGLMPQFSHTTRTIKNESADILGAREEGDVVLTWMASHDLTK